MCPLSPCSPFSLWLAPGAGMGLGLVAAHYYTENPSSCDQLLLTNTLVQKHWWWLWLQGAPSDLYTAKDMHDTPPS